MTGNRQRRSIRPSAGGVGSLLCLLWASLGAAPVGAQAGPFDGFFDPLARQPLRLELIVEDDRGRRPSGLGASDFDFELDGRPADVARFRALDGLRGEGSFAGPLLPAGEELTVALLLDRTGLGPRDEEQLLDALGRGLLPLLRREDRLLVFVFQGGLHRAGTVDVDDPEAAARLRQAVTTATAGRPPPEADPGLTPGRLESLERVLDALAAMPGRRLALHVGHDPLAVEPAAEEEEVAATDQAVTFHPADDPWGAGPAAAVGDGARLDGVVESAQASLVTLYTLDPADLLRDPCGGREGPSGDGSLAAAAARSGGAALALRGCDEPRLEPLASDLAAYCVVELHLAEVGLGVARNVRLRPRSPALTVRHRESFFDRPARNRVADLATAGLLLDRADNPLAIDVEHGSPQRAGADAYAVPLTLRVPFRQVHFRPLGREHVGRLHVYLGAYDEQGHFTPVESFDSPLRVANDELPEALRRVGLVELDTTLPAGRQRLVLAVHDEHAGRTSIVVLELDLEEDG